tara:strand:- start:940 stop:1110 length:171 start_codon:yes stop_codon:yes gene_type:complete
MIELLIATALTCSEAQELIEKVSVSQGIDRDSVIEVIKATTEPECYESEGSETSNS